MPNENALTKYGMIRGDANKQVLCWKGIPYAQNPAGNGRFMRAQPLKPQPYDARDFGPSCPQNKQPMLTEDGNCLTLNIWSPAADGKERAVLFFIHGGSFESGAGSDAEYNGANLAYRGDIVVVTINYRLGALGFLDFSFLGDGFQSNCGLSDMLAALKWVHENIHAFGGDPQSITVMGQSAGATACSALSVMPAARPYISKIIMMSGGPSWIHTKGDCLELSRKFLEHAGIDSADELNSASTQYLIKKQKTFSKLCGLGAGTFTPTVDGDLLPCFPIPAAVSGATGGIPMLIGTTKEEMSFLCLWPVNQILKLKDLMQSIICRESEATQSRLKSVYRKNYKAMAKSMLLTDHVFRLSSMWFAQAACAHANTWMYRFDYSTAAMNIAFLRSCHSTDIPFVFGNFKARHYKFMFMLSFFSRTAGRIAGDMQNDFITFAKTGALPWKKVKDSHDTPAKCYSYRTGVKPMVEPAVAAQYENSLFKKASLKGIGTLSQIST